MIHELVRVLLDSLSGPQWWALTMALGCHAVAVLLHTLAWRMILAHEYGGLSVHWRTVLGGYSAGSAVNAFVPARAGIVLKLFIIKTRIRGATYPSVLASLGALAVFDVFVTLAIVAWAIKTTMLPDPGQLVHYQGFIARWALDHPVGLAAVVPAILTVLASLGFALHCKLRTLAVEFLRGFRVLACPPYYLRRVVPLQVLNWIAQLAALGFFLTALGLPVTPRNILLAQAAKSLAALVPFTPSGAGAQFALLVLAFGREFPAVTVGEFAIGMRLATTAFNVAIGAGVMVCMLGTLRWRRALDRLKDADWAGTNAGRAPQRNLPAATSRS